MTEAKRKSQARSNRRQRQRVKANNGGKRCFGAGLTTKHEFGVIAGREYGRGTMNGIPICY